MGVIKARKWKKEGLFYHSRGAVFQVLVHEILERVHEIGRKFLTRINSKSSLDFEKPQEVQTCPDFSLDGDSRKIAL